MSNNKRKALKIKPEELFQFFLDKYYSDDDYVHPNDAMNLYQIFNDNEQLQKDFKVNFDFENYEAGLFPYAGDEWLGIRNKYFFGGNFSFLACLAGGDWEYPVNFILYLDNKKKLRAYVPTEGNTFNYDTKEAIGNDYEKDSKFLAKWFKKNKKDFYDLSEELQSENIADATDYAESLYDVDLMIRDIEQRIEVV